MSSLLEVLKFIGILFLVLLIFNFIIIVHEWGHFLAARWRGLKIEKFQIWMGKCLWKRTYNGVQYGLGTIPLGGFVQLPQMAPMGAIEGKTGENGEALPPIKPLDKIIVAFAGPLFSFLLALAFACAVSIVGKPVRQQETSTAIGYTMPGMPAAVAGLKAGDKILEIDGKPVKGFFRLADSVVWAIASGRSDDVLFKIQRPDESAPRSITVHAPYKESAKYREWDEDTGWFKKLYTRPPIRMVGIGPATEGKIKTIQKNSPAAEAGLQPGDIPTALNGEKLYHPEYLNILAKEHAGEDFHLTVLREGKEISATFKPRIPDKPEGLKEARTGIEQFEELDPNQRAVLDHPNPFTLIGDCFRNTAATLSALFSPGSSIGVSQMSGPVGIMHVYYTIFQNPDWWRLVLWFSVVLNIGLAIFNMFPLPVLDGGHITMALLEMVRGKAIGTKFLEIVQLACVLCLFSFVIFVTFKDVGGLKGDEALKEEFLPPATSGTPVP